MGKPAARKTDRHDCPLYDGDDPHIGGPVVSGCDTVLIRGLPAARKGDPTLCEGVGAIDPIAKGEPTVRIGGADAARKTDPTEHGGVLVQGCDTVLIGAADGCADGKCKGDPATGSPVNPLLGIKILPPETDIDLPSPLGWRWFRFYSSDEARVGPLGQGWNHPAALAITLGADTILTDTQGRNIRFLGRLAPGEERYSPSEGLWLVRGGGSSTAAGRWLGLDTADWRDPARYFVTDGAGQFFVFGQSATAAIAQAAGTATSPPPPDSDATGRLALDSQRSRLGTVAHYEWRGERLDAVTDSAGRRYRFRYERICPASEHDSGERLVRIELGAEHSPAHTAVVLVHYQYSPAGDLTAVLDRHKRWQRRFAWRNHVMIGHEAPGRRSVRYEYDRYAPDGRVLRQTQQHGLVYRFNYHPDHTEVSDSLGRIARYWHEGEGGLKRVIRHDRPDGSVLVNRHDAHGRLVSSHVGRLPLAELPAEALADPLAHPSLFRSTRFQRNAAGRPTVVDAASLVTRYTWGADGQVAAITDADGATTRFEHDALGRLMAQTGPDGARTLFLYDDVPDGPPAVQPARIRDARGGFKQLTYNALGLLTAYTDCSGRTTRYHYDHWGQLIESEDAAGGRTLFERDAFDRVAEVLDAAGHRTRYRFDEADRVVEIEDTAGRRHRQQYDEAGRLVSQHPEGGHALSLGFDAADRLVEVINQNGAVHRLAFDAADRLACETTPDGRTLRYAYDALGQLVERDDAGLVTTQAYDDAGRLVERHLPATAQVPAQVQRFAWRGSRLVAAHTDTHTLGFEHDATGRVVRETLTSRIPLPGGEPFVCERATAHAYGVLGSRATTRLPNGLELGQLTYGSGHVHQLRIADRVLADIEHDALYRPVRLRLGGYPGLIETLAFDALGALTATRVCAPGGQPVVEARYDYDALGRLVAREGSDGERRFVYDSIDRLIGEAGNHQARYRFDPAGNRLSAAPAKPASRSEDWVATVRANLHDPAFNPLGEYGGPRHAPGPEGCPDNRLFDLDGVSYRYDRWGNLVERIDADGARTVLAYDAEHRLVALARYHGATLAHQAAYTYDSFGRRRSKALSLPTTPDADAPLALRQLTRFDWDGDRMVGEHLATFDPRDQTWTEAEHVFAYHPDAFTPLARITCQPHATGKASIGHIDWFHTDQIGTPLALFDAEGKETWTIRLDAWGKRLDTPPPPDPRYAFSGATDPNDQPIRLPGQYFDAESGMHYNRYRYYDPSAGRYVTQDPIGLAGGLNLYGYALQYPTLYSDPNGLEVYVCTRPVDISWLNFLPEGARPTHTWIKTGTYESGMGGECPVPGQGCADIPWVTQTKTIDHSGQADAPNASCSLMQNVDEDCVNERIAPGQEQGTWTPYNQCQSFAWSVIGQCRYGPQIGPILPRTTLQERGPLGSSYAP